MHPDIQVLLDGGLRTTHIASLLAVNRNTVSKWIAGKSPHTMVHPALRRLAAAVSAAIESGKLPVPSNKLAPGEAYLRTYAVAKEYRDRPWEGDGD